MKDPNIDINDVEEIVIIVPEDADEDEIIIDLDALGIDVESLDEDVNIIIQVEGAEELEDDFIDEDDDEEPMEWYFDDDPYGIVYYEFAGE